MAVARLSQGFALLAAHGSTGRVWLGRGRARARNAPGVEAAFEEEGVEKVVSIEHGNRAETGKHDYYVPISHGSRQVYGEDGAAGGAFHTWRQVGPMLALAHDTLPAWLARDAGVYLYFVRDGTNSGLSVSLEPDTEGLEVSVRSSGPGCRSSRLGGAAV